MSDTPKKVTQAEIDEFLAKHAPGATIKPAQYEPEPVKLPEEVNVKETKNYNDENPRKKYNEWMRIIRAHEQARKRLITTATSEPWHMQKIKIVESWLQEATERANDYRSRTRNSLTAEENALIDKHRKEKDNL